MGELRETIRNDYLGQTQRQNSEYFDVTKKITLIDPETSLIPTSPVTKSSLIETADEMLRHKYPKLDVIYTSPFPVGHYKMTFGRDLKKSTGKDGSIGKITCHISD